MKTVKLYTPIELKKKYPEGYENALEWFRSDQGEIPWQGEIMDSFKAVFERSGLELRDWSISGDYPSSSWVKFHFPYFYAAYGAKDLTGQRALAWLENNLLSQFRYKDGIQYIKERVWRAECVKNPRRSDGVFIHKAGELKSCPLTGVCFDEDFIQSLLKDIKDGCTLGEAYKNLAYVAGKLFEQEIEYQNSEENFLEQELTFTKDGHYVYAS